MKPSNLGVWVEKDLGRKREKDKTLGWDGWGHYLDWKKGTGWSLDSQAALTGLEITGRGERLGETAKRLEGWGLQALQALRPSVLENLPSPLTSHTVWVWEVSVSFSFT